MKKIQQALKPEQLGPSSSIRLKFVYVQKQLIQISYARLVWFHESDFMGVGVHMYIASKRIELESPGCSGFEANLISFES